MNTAPHLNADNAQEQTISITQNRGKEEDKGTVLRASQVTLSNRFDALLEQEE
ncbi:hypothetical protein HID58_053889 [Brassica napus]|uniref:Uncharacterized protein n=1 Tax=Brassica napus TaxID=3708 RepID=A0ABQ8AHH4_BRANA|nr:hypothetical protein HID58_053889 [Brassica napus]